MIIRFLVRLLIATYVVEILVGLILTAAVLFRLAFFP